MSNRDSKDVKRPRKNKRARKHFSKKSTVSLHFSKRCLQRLGYIPDESALIKKIQENKLEFLSSHSYKAVFKKVILNLVKLCIQLAIYKKSQKREKHFKIP